MRKATALLITLQAVILFVMIAFFVTSKNPPHKYDLREIARDVESREVATHTSNHHAIVKRLRNNICLDSHGVYRQCDDDTYEKIIDTDRIEYGGDGEKDSSDVEKESDDEMNSAKRKMNSVNVRVRKNLSDEDSIFPLWSGDSNLQEKEKSIESATYQSSAMGNMKKIISSKVKNANKRFVSDKRILFSEVYEQVDSVEDVKLLVIVTTAARKRARRDSIRATWWNQCAQDSTVRCFFFTDDYNSPSLKSAKKELLREKEKYGDIIFQPIDIGLKFGYRMLYQMQWSVAHYRFQYLLRVDDDALVCLSHLLHDLPHFPKTNLQWGHLHCVQDDVIYMDEGLTIFSRDLVLKFLSQNPLKMRCHALGDQQVAIWIGDLNLDPEELYVHDSRIHHTPPASGMKEYFFELDDICKTHIIVHGVYPSVMEDFWEVANKKEDYPEYKPSKFIDSCDRPASFDWDALDYPYKHKPHYCIKNPDWDETSLLEEDGTFAGREGKDEAL